MVKKPVDLQEMFRRALMAQVDLGVGELVLGSQTAQAALPRALAGTETQILPVREAIESGRTLELRKPREEQASFQLMPESTFVSLKQHYDATCDCQKCPLGATRTTFVYGVGDSHADLMFIGEAPGAEEDRQGLPFVGRAGQLLDKILAAINLTRDEVYIANMLKCRPPGNRDPLPDEMASCTPYLREQIRLIKPKLICMLGRIAAQGLLRTTTPLGKLRGHWHQFEGIPVLVTYHPAALLRFPAYKKDTWEDMKRLKARYDELT